MSKELLQKVINKGTGDNLNVFFQDVSKYYAEFEDDLSNYNDDQFTNFQAAGEIVFNPNEKLVVVIADVAGDLTERSGKKTQYEKAKKILKSYTRYDAGIFVFSDSAGNFRFSLVYGTPDATRLAWNNFRRFTYFVSRDQTNNTFLNRVGNCAFSSLEMIKDAFSVEKVNKEFYIKIAEFFYRLTGKNNYEREMSLPSVGEDDNKTYEEFAVRLIGRSIFCWFLKYKKSAEGIPLIAKEALSVAAVQNHSNYYHSISEQLFFELMNTPIKDRKSLTIPDAGKVPFLNGGLFEPHENDFYKPSLINALKIPNKWFIDFFTVLEQYNFTIDENSTVDADVSVDPEMLGRIFENLLAEVNPVTGETARKATGSYYTPRTIVDYMVEESLKQYLLTKTSLSEDKITTLLSYDDNTQEFNPSEKEAVVKASKEIRIIDPACGSGAFPMGILHRMLLALEKVDPNLEIWRRLYLSTYHPVMRKIIEDKLNKGNEHYIRKLTLIQDSIYGVDIQPIAVEISKLRCFLSLVVDELVFDNEDNRGIEPLPNLEFKFVAANSLIGLPKVAEQSAFGITETVNKLKELRESYLNSYAKDKKQIEKDFRATQRQLFEENVAWAVSEDLVKLLTEWDPFSYETSSWFDPGWMFGVTSGFDIVIANPPYLGESGHKEIFRNIKQGTLAEYYQGKMDIFYFFFHLALNLGNSHSQIAFISTNYYPTATGASKLRQDLKKRSIIRRLINFNELKIFESAQGQHNLITLIEKGQNKEILARTCITKRNGFATPETLSKILSWIDAESNYHTIYQEDLFDGKENYIRLDMEHSTSVSKGVNINDILDKIAKGGGALGTIANIDQGVVSGCDYVSNRNIDKLSSNHDVINGDGIFVIDLENSRDKNVISKFNETDLALLKPFFKNSDIRRYWSAKHATKKLIYIDRSINSLMDCPNVALHLKKFRAILSDRREVENGIIKYFQLQWPRTEAIFTGEKIVVPYRSETNTFAYDSGEWFCRSDCYVITQMNATYDLKYLLALLNSTLYFKWLYHRGKRKGEMLELFQVPLSEIPIKPISTSEQKSFIALVDKILAITKDPEYFSNSSEQIVVGKLEERIDEMVYQLYELTPEEIDIVKCKK
jgi:adenine-specific DNA-methyltransferase